MKILVINGPNLNMLGIREPDIYGSKTFSALESFVRDICDAEGIEVTLFQSNYEGALVEKIQQYKTVFVYMPTWRDSQRDCFANGFDLEAFNQCVAAQNACVLMKPHANTIIDKSIAYSNLFFLDGNVDMYCILPYTHVLITDYSSILYDYILMPNKHVILFHYDYDEYVNSREFIFDIQENIVGKQVSRDIWVQKLRCPCGCGFRRDKWYTYANGTHSYGYTCYKQLNEGSKKRREKDGLDTEGYCDTPMIAAWKMDCMAQEVMQQLWTDQNESLQIAIELLKQFYKEADSGKQVNRNAIQNQIDRLKKRINGYVEMRADGDLTKEEYTAKRSQAEAEISKLEAELAEPEEADHAEREAKLNSIIATLKSLVQTEDGKVDENLIKHFIENSNH